MKRFTIVLMAVALMVGCWSEPKTSLYDNVAGLEIAFKRDLVLSEDQFLVYVQALSFLGKEIDKGSSLEWTGPDDIFGGKIEVIAVDVSDGKVCKEFTQTLNHNDTVYEGHAKLCSVGSTWELIEVAR